MIKVRETQPGTKKGAQVGALSDMETEVLNGAGAP